MASVLTGLTPSPAQALATGPTWLPALAARSLPAPLTAPAAVSGAAMAYDAARNVVVLFGGSSATGAVLRDTWEWNGAWTLRTPAAPALSPSARAGASMVFDAARSVIVLFGGNGGGLFNDTWTWNGTTWTLKTPLTSPPPRSSAAMAYDGAAANAVLFGGTSFAGMLDDTWLWNGTTWTQQALISRPFARSGAGIAFDEARGNVVMFGGYDASLGAFGDTWIWSGNPRAWTRPVPATSPSRRYGVAMSYHAGFRQVILFGGANTTPFADTWAWNGTSWIQQAPLLSPFAGSGMVSAYDSARGNTVLFAGGTLPVFSTWVYGDPTLSTATPPAGQSGDCQRELMANPTGTAVTPVFDIAQGGVRTFLYVWQVSPTVVRVCAKLAAGPVNEGGRITVDTTGFPPAARVSYLADPGTNVPSGGLATTNATAPLTPSGDCERGPGGMQLLDLTGDLAPVGSTASPPGTPTLSGRMFLWTQTVGPVTNVCFRAGGTPGALGGKLALDQTPAPGTTGTPPLTATFTPDPFAPVLPTATVSTFPSPAPAPNASATCQNSAGAIRLLDLRESDTATGTTKRTYLYLQPSGTTVNVCARTDATPTPQGALVNLTAAPAPALTVTPDTGSAVPAAFVTTAGGPTPGVPSGDCRTDPGAMQVFDVATSSAQVSRIYLYTSRSATVTRVCVRAEGAAPTGGVLEFDQTGAVTPGTGTLRWRPDPGTAVPTFSASTLPGPVPAVPSGGCQATPGAQQLLDLTVTPPGGPPQRIYAYALVSPAAARICVGGTPALPIGGRVDVLASPLSVLFVPDGTAVPTAGATTSVPGAPAVPSGVCQGTAGMTKVFDVTLTVGTTQQRLYAYTAPGAAGTTNVCVGTGAAGQGLRLNVNPAAVPPAPPITPTTD